LPVLKTILHSTHEIEISEYEVFSSMFHSKSKIIFLGLAGSFLEELIKLLYISKSLFSSQLFFISLSNFNSTVLLEVGIISVSLNFSSA
jgi:hypothetical protein